MTKIERRKQAIKPIPPFTTIEEEAEWFDTHDMADYQDEFKTVKARLAKRLSEGLNIRLDKETLAAIRAEAQEKGVGPTTLARMWILERLDELKKEAAINNALDELKGMIAKRYPDATFKVERGDDPPGMYLTATVDVEDVQEVLDVVIDRLIDMQVEEGLAVHVMPLRPREREIEDLQASGRLRKPS